MRPNPEATQLQSLTPTSMSKPSSIFAKNPCILRRMIDHWNDGLGTPDQPVPCLLQHGYTVPFLRQPQSRTTRELWTVRGPWFAQETTHLVEPNYLPAACAGSRIGTLRFLNRFFLVRRPALISSGAASDPKNSLESRTVKVSYDPVQKF